MATGIEISVRWFDNDLVELAVSASNGRFSGSVETYADLEVFPKLAATLEGFPVSSTDARQFEFGTFDPSFAGGGARLQFRCLNHVGKSCVEIHLRADPRVIGSNETASFIVGIEAAAIDTFVTQLKAIRLEPNASISLPAV
jgi:hypothetical protein